MYIPSLEKSNLFEFTTDEYQFILAGYPVWKAFVAYRDSNIWIESYFRIDVSKRIIFFSKAKTKTQKEIKESSILDQLICDDIESEKRKIEDFFNTIPEDIRHAVAKLPDSQWEAIENIILLGKDLITLLNTKPALAYIIINAKKINPAIRLLNEAIVLKKMILTKQKEIIGKCGFPETEQMVKIFTRIDPAIINVSELINFRNLLMIDEELKERILNILSFAKTINRNLLNLIIYHSPLLTILDNKIIYELAASESYNEHLIMIRQLYLNSKRWQLTAPKIISLTGINKVLEKQLVAVEKKRQKENAFPTPPLEDNFYISAICRESELVSWSKRQHNCIRSYAYAVKAKQKYFYKVIYGNEEATLELKLGNGRIQRGDLLGVYNKAVTPELKEIVNEWLKDARKRKKEGFIRTSP